ncbi:hypothetical protein CAEBREN_00957 [Caenorhabditis brenneri]|uniref:Uncharacterized protein n=1 Tax=Caenorhabditis brenneri TaxID=135651 RepID=G0N3W3_CAEBE|nr:hypothetical protein CAEBREN_00957 [Caenorhabditis brenneri]
MAFFRLNDPCIPLHVESDCVLFLQVLVAGISGMIYGQTGLLVERACATFMKEYGRMKSLLIGSLICLMVLVLSGSTGRIIVWDDTLKNYLLSCNSFPRQSQERSATFFSICTFLSLFNLLISVFMWKYNQKFEYSTPFVVGPRFRKREVLDSTSTICFLAFIQFIFMFIYSFGIFMLKTFRENFTYEQYYFWVVWLYTIPFTAALFPVLLVYRIRSSHFSRVMIIKKFTNTKQTQEDHIKQMKKVWD